MSESATNGLNRSLPDADDELLVRYAAGDRSAFEELVRRHRSRLYNFVFRQMQHQAVAEELVQETFVRVVSNLREFKREARFSTWLFTIARNLCFDELRKRKHRRHASLDQPTSSGSSESGDQRTLGERTADPDRDTEREATQGELRDKMSWAIAKLPDDQREVFLLREVSGLPFKEIAEATGVSENTVKSRMRYAIERLQAALVEYEQYAKELATP